ncbi:MAG: MotA/TolQ/ExbB proton channel family protein [Lentisphaerae bacterium]|nr:MotA/TolQ/ExbB proton channel family protein [Lentisphaerota bacterium]
MTTRTRIVLSASLAACLGLLVYGASAQEAAPTAAAPAAETVAADAAPSTTFLGLLKQGGVLMFPLGLLSVATVALAVFGFLSVRESKMLTPDLVPPLQEALGQAHLEEAVTICQGTPSLLTNVLNAGLQRISDGILDIPSLEKAMEEASVEETQAGLKTISYLSIIAQLAPMLGLLGTVSGMIKAFEKIGQGAMGKPEVLAGNIGEALVTTATGLIIGIPAMFLYFHLKSRYISNVTKLGRVVGDLSHHLVAASRRQEAGTT